LRTPFGRTPRSQRPTTNWEAVATRAVRRPNRAAPPPSLPAAPGQAAGRIAAIERAARRKWRRRGKNVGSNRTSDGRAAKAGQRAGWTWIR
jgi:hypothetical protein